MGAVLTADPEILPATANGGRLRTENKMLRTVFLRDRRDGCRMKDVVAAEPVIYLGQDFPNPAGLPRPRVRGLPFPWVTPMVDETPRFRDLDRVRAEMCRSLWGCQVCGEDLDPVAWVAVKEAKPGSAIVSSAAMHRRCLDLAVRHCPRLGDPASGCAFAEVSRQDIHPRPEQAAEHDERQPKMRWYLRADGQSYDFRSLDEIKSAS